MLSLPDVALELSRLDVAARRDDLCAERLEHRPLLGRHRLGDHDDAAVTTDGAHDGQPDAGIPRAGLYDRRTGGQEAAVLCVLDHRERGAVLHAPARREVLELRNHLRAPVRDDARQPYEGRPSDGGEDIPEDHDAAFFSLSQRAAPWHHRRGITARCTSGRDTAFAPDGSATGRSSSICGRSFACGRASDQGTKLAHAVHPLRW